MEKIKSGFVVIVGRPNVGKSTLLNTILNIKITIVTSKAQTTRNRIQGIFNDNESQIIFIDTPGIHKAHNEMGKFMNKIALSSIKSADVILFLVPVNERIHKNDKYILKIIQERNIAIILVITKTDLVKQRDLKNKIKEWEDIVKFKNIVLISSLKYNNINKLLTIIKNNLSLGIKYYPDNMLTDQPKLFLIREIIREKILLLTNEEIPHSVAILIDKLTEKKDLIKIIASICVEHTSQKGIIIGKNGKMIKEIGIKARSELEEILNAKVYLELFVKVVEKWRNKLSMIAKLGYNKKNY